MSSTSINAPLESSLSEHSLSNAFQPIHPGMLYIENKSSSCSDSPQAAKLTPPHPANAVRKIVIKKGPTGFGIAISEDKYKRLIVRGLNPNGVAFTDGRMQVGDEIIAVNSKCVSTMKYDDVMNLLHVTKEPVEFQVGSHSILTPKIHKTQFLFFTTHKSISFL